MFRDMWLCFGILVFILSFISIWDCLNSLYKIYCIKGKKKKEKKKTCYVDILQIYVITTPDITALYGRIGWDLLHFANDMQYCGSSSAFHITEKPFQPHKWLNLIQSLIGPGFALTYQNPKSLQVKRTNAFWGEKSPNCRNLYIYRMYVEDLCVGWGCHPSTVAITGLLLYLKPVTFAASVILLLITMV